ITLQPAATMFLLSRHYAIFRRARRSTLFPYTTLFRSRPRRTTMRTPRRLSLFFFVVFSLSLAACDGCEDGCAAKGEEGASTPKERSALSEAEDFAAEIDATVSDDVEALTQADIDRFRTELENMLKLLAEATQAGIDAERGDSHCERALTGMRALVDHVAEKRGEPARPIDGPAFIQTC